MHCGLARRVVAPAEGAVRKLDAHAFAQHPVPQHANLLALADAVGGHKGHADAFACGAILRFGEIKNVGGGFAVRRRFGLFKQVGLFGPGECGGQKFALALIRLGGTLAREVLRRLDVPRGDVIEHAAAAHRGRRQHSFDVFLLLGRLVLLAYERWIAEDEVQIHRRAKLGPVQIKRVADTDVG